MGAVEVGGAVFVIVVESVVLGFVDDAVEVVVDEVVGVELVGLHGEPDGVAESVAVVVDVGPGVHLFGGYWRPSVSLTGTGKAAAPVAGLVTAP